PAREGVPQILALGVLPDRPGLHRPHHVALGIPHLDLNDARKVAHESGALVGPALGAARALAGQQLRQAAAIHRSLGDRGGLGPLGLGGHHVEEPAQPDAEGAGEDRDPGQADEDGAQQRPERYPRHEGLPCRSSASRLDSSSGKRSAETGRAKWYPWPCSQPRARSWKSCSAVSTPSAVTTMPRLRARATTARTMAVSSVSLPTPLTSERSIFRQSTGRRLR